VTELAVAFLEGGYVDDWEEVWFRGEETSDENIELQARDGK